MKFEDIIIYFEESIYDGNFYPKKNLFLIGYDHLSNEYFHGQFIFFSIYFEKFRVTRNNINFLIDAKDIFKISEENISDYLIFG